LIGCAVKRAYRACLGSLCRSVRFRSCDSDSNSCARPRRTALPNSKGRASTTGYGLDREGMCHGGGPAECATAPCQRGSLPALGARLRLWNGAGRTWKVADQPIKPALAVLGTAEVPALVMEELADGRCLVFVPASPKPSQGFLHVPASMSILSMQVITRLLRATGGRHDEDAPTGGKVRITRSRRR